MNTIETALHWKSLGVATIPAYPNSKYLHRGIKAKYYIDNPPVLADFVRWWHNKPNNICLIADNGLTVLDFDTVSDYEKWRSKYQASTYTVKSRRGYHCYFWIDEPVPAGTCDYCEIKANGKPVVIPPSKIGDFQYHAIDDTEILRVGSIDEVCDYSPSKKRTSQNLTVNIQTNYGTVNVGRSSFTRRSTSLIADIKSYFPITAIFTDYTPSGDGMAMARCPMSAHPRGDENPSLSLDLRTNRFNCFRPDCPLSLPHGGDAIDGYRILHNLSFKQALAAMAKELGF